MNKEEKTISSILYTTQYAYDLENILNSITYPSGRTVTYTLDQIGRIAQVSTTLNGNPKTLASSISYLPYGGITNLTFGNSLPLSHGYDNQYRTSSIVIGSILSRTYGYDANGNVTSIVDTEPLASDENAGLYTYQQSTNKLTQVAGDLNVAYGYDANGNITSANNRTFVYDLSNRLIRVEDNSVTIAEYVYNANNQRIKKIVQGATRIFHYDLTGHLIAETNGVGQTLAEYFYLGDQVLCKISGEAAYYYHNDHLGTPQILTNDSGTVSWKAAYTPFGEAEIQVEIIENPFRFPGQYYDQETGLHYNWNRYYDSKTGRYLTPDPIGLKGGINLFIYVQNNPGNSTDSLGLQGGPYHPPEGVETKCSPMDNCSELEGKVFILEKMIKSHAGWDRHMPSPRGGGRHKTEIAQLWTQLAECQSIYEKKCTDKCKDKEEKTVLLPELPPMPWWGPVVIVGGGMVITCIVCPACCGFLVPIIAL